MEALRPYLVGERPNEDGEWDMFCPLHTDNKRSAGINIDKGVWFCQAGCGGGRVSELMLQKADWSDPPAGQNGHANVKLDPDNRREKQPGEVINDKVVDAWADVLNSEPAVRDALAERRGLHYDTIRKYRIGFDSETGAYTIPVLGWDGEIWNVRRYLMDAPQWRTKMWSVKGMGAPRLYPVSVFESDPPSIIICEGEWDTLLTIQNGFAAVTRTGAAKVWKSDWSRHFEGRVVYLCHDADKTGVAANRMVAKALSKIAKEVRLIRLPYPIVEKHGKDISDYWLEGRTPADFKKLMEVASVWGAESELVGEPVEASVLDAFDARLCGNPLRINVTIKGKREPGYSVAKKVKYTCTRDAGNKCAICPLFPQDGEDELTLSGNDPIALELMGATKVQVFDILRQRYGIPKCSKLGVEAVELQAVEVLLGRPSVDAANNGGAGDYKTIKITSVGRHDTLPNNTVQVVGSLYPDPRAQTNEFLAWEVSRLQTSIDAYEPDRATLRQLRRFQPGKRQRPLQKLAQIASELETHVTHIYGRPEMHAVMDLVFHSALSFNFGGQRISRGWLELLVVGDTRTGKSEAAEKLCDHYSAGEVVSCESASFAGIVGGAQQMGGKEWVITWGAIPINDRRLVVLDEVGGLSQGEIASMSSVRSSGVAEITKIAQERTHARTRLIWLGNPRDATMGHYTYGVQAIRPLIGNAEDIARFDLAMSVQSGDVDQDLINQERAGGELRYPAELCHALLRWVWSRTPEQIKWAPGTPNAVYTAAKAMGKRYVEDPPLVQAANVRLKIARVAVAMAARLFSTDDTFENIVVTKEHVRDAVEFMNRLYGMPGFGYGELSKERIDDLKEARNAQDHMRHYLAVNDGLGKFLRNSNSFRRQDLEEIMNMSREEANAVINILWSNRMVRKDPKGDVRVEPALHGLLREVR